METNNALQQVISSPSFSKAYQQELVDSLISKVEDGLVDPMKAYIQVKAVMEVCKSFLESDAVVNATSDAVATCGDNLPDFNGAKVSFATTTRYDYSSSNDRQYLELLAQKTSIATKLKAREMFLKSIDESIDCLDNETGEVVTIFAPKQTQSRTLRVNFAKR